MFMKIRSSDASGIAAEVENCVNVFSGEHISDSSYRIYMVELAADIYRFVDSCSFDPEELFGRENVFDILMQLKRGDAVRAWLTSVAVRMNEKLRDRGKLSIKGFVKEAMEFVKDNYSDPDITIETVCDNLGVSTSYFSTTFKKDLGVTFITYLTNVRMNAAASLLEREDEKTCVVAMKVGYSNPNYFSYAFKKHFGISPSRYRSLDRDRVIEEGK